MFTNKIKTKLLVLSKRNLSTEEKAVMSCIMQGYKNNTVVTQNDIAISVRWIGCHPKHEVDIVANRLSTTKRQVRQVVRYLKVNHHAPILSSDKGYFIPRTQAEVDTYILRLEAQTKAQIISYQETYKAMKQSLETTSNFFEELE